MCRASHSQPGPRGGADQINRNLALVSAFQLLSHNSNYDEDKNKTPMHSSKSPRQSCARRGFSSEGRNITLRFSVAARKRIQAAQRKRSYWVRELHGGGREVGDSSVSALAPPALLYVFDISLRNA